MFLSDFYLLTNFYNLLGHWELYCFSKMAESTFAKDVFLNTFFFSTGVWTQGLVFARQVLYHLNHTSIFGYFWDRVSLYAQAGLDHNPIYTPA
jgi:hypothetical protein